MQTPDSWAGQLTEKIMSRIRRKHPDILRETREYNPVWSTVLEVLEEESKDQPDVVARLLRHDPTFFGNL